MEKSEQFQPHAWILGVDVSKQSIDVCLIRSSDGPPMLVFHQHEHSK